MFYFLYFLQNILKISKKYDLKTPVYIDSSLKNGEKGEELAKQLSDLGFTELYLATGYSETDFPKMPYIKGFVGKKGIFK